MSPLTSTIEIDGVAYSAALASAVNQDEILSILTSSIMQRGLHAQLNSVNMSDDILVPMFMGMDVTTKRKVAPMLMYKVAVVGTSQLVTVADFQGRMVSYNKLLSKLLQWNLSDFFVWLNGVLNSEKPPADNPPVMG